MTTLIPPDGPGPLKAILIPLSGPGPLTVIFVLPPSTVSPQWLPALTGAASPDNTQATLESITHCQPYKHLSIKMGAPPGPGAFREAIKGSQSVLLGFPPRHPLLVRSIYVYLYCFCLITCCVSYISCYF